MLLGLNESGVSVREFSVIIPQHGRSDLTLAAVTSLQQFSTDIEIVIVDDGSPGDTCKFLQSQLRGNICIVRLPTRGGVTRAWNRGAAIASGEFFVFLNNDTLTHGNWLPQLMAPLISNESLMTAPDWRIEPELALDTSFVSAHEKLLSGWCLALRRHTFLRMNGFDEQYRLYFSDTDLQLRLQQQHPNSLEAVSGLPLQHLGHCSTRRLSSRSREWRGDRNLFRWKWSKQLGQSIE